jgi:SAM-dependent methyltransferase
VHKAGLEYFYVSTGDVFALDNSQVEKDEHLMRLGHFWGYDNLIGQSCFFEIHSDNLRESVHSTLSRCSNRIRQLVASLAILHQLDISSSMEDILRRKYKGKRILLLEERSAFASVFMHLCKSQGIDLVTSEYFGSEYKSGEYVDSVLHVDIQNTGFPENYFDLIIHTDVFEHIPFAPQGEQEIARILKPQGHALFSVPFGFNLTTDDIYAEFIGRELFFHKEAVYHDDPMASDGRCLVFRIFSIVDMSSRYKRLNCAFTSYYFHCRQMGIIGNNACIFIATKKSFG